LYQSLYRKWRPQSFADAVGQRHVTDTLKKQAAAGRLSHAYIFTGTRGTGKTTYARILVKAANCLDLRDGDPCNECAACASINRGDAVDFIEIDAASNNGVDNVRDLREQAVYTPVSLKKRAYIIDEVHMLSGGAFNALLKILEEPPEHVLFILATTEAYKVPATILSRCQRFDFRRFSVEEITATLEKIAAAEGAVAEPGCLAAVAALADGAMRNALTSLELIIAHAAGRKIDAGMVDQALGLSGSRYLFDLYSRCLGGDVCGALDIFEQAFDAGADLAALADEMYTMTRDLLIARFRGNKAGFKGIGYGHDARALAGLAASAGAAKLSYYARALERLINKAATKGLRRAEFEMLIIQLALPEVSGGTEALSARIEALEAGIIPHKTRQSPPGAREKRVEETNADIEAVPPAAEKDIEAADVEEIPPAIIQIIDDKPIMKSDGSQLDTGKLLLALASKAPRAIKPFLSTAGMEIKDHEIMIKCADEMCVSLLSGEEFLKMVVDEAEALCGARFAAKCVFESQDDSEDKLAELEEF